MPASQKKAPTNDGIPIGIVLLTLGLLIIVMTGLALLLASLKTPGDQTLNLPQQTSVQHSKAVQAILITPTPDPNHPEPQLPILLPESVPDDGRLPSHAAVDEAPRNLNELIPNQPIRLLIPKLGIDVPVSRVKAIPKEVDGALYFQWEVPRGYEVGWHDTSAPLGQPGNTVLNGHNNIYGEVFRDLIELQPGEEIIIYDADQPYEYMITQREVLPENGQPIETRLQNANWINPTDDERITLVTCWPYATNANRLVVIAQPKTKLGF